MFDFLLDNQNLVTSLTLGMSGFHVTGLDRYKLSELAKTYNIDLSRWMFAVKYFEEGLLTQYNTKKDS